LALLLCGERLEDANPGGAQPGAILTLMFAAN